MRYAHDVKGGTFFDFAHAEPVLRLAKPVLSMIEGGSGRTRCDNSLFLTKWKKMTNG